MKTTGREPTLLFFRERPHGWSASASIAGSLQSIETSFFLTALGRHPHALLVCTSAIESCLQAASIGAKERDGLQGLIKKAGSASVEIQNFPAAFLDRLREARNRSPWSGFRYELPWHCGSILKRSRPCWSLKNCTKMVETGSWFMSDSMESLFTSTSMPTPWMIFSRLNSWALPIQSESWLITGAALSLGLNCSSLEGKGMTS